MQIGVIIKPVRYDNPDLSPFTNEEHSPSVTKRKKKKVADQTHLDHQKKLKKKRSAKSTMNSKHCA